MNRTLSDSAPELAEGWFPALPAPLMNFRFISLWPDGKSGSR